MGIHGLAKLIADHAPGAIREQDIKNYFGNHNRLRFPFISRVRIKRSTLELNVRFPLSELDQCCVSTKIEDIST